MVSYFTDVYVCSGKIIKYKIKLNKMEENKNEKRKERIN